MIPVPLYAGKSEEPVCADNRFTSVLEANWRALRMAPTSCNYFTVAVNNRKRGCASDFSTIGVNLVFLTKIFLCVHKTFLVF